MATGTVKWFSDDKGYGFITPDEAGKDLFVHHSAISSSGFRTLAEGAKVSFDVEPGSLIEKAARGMRHVKRAARADLHRFKALIEMSGLETGAWRGRIEDGELVEEHDPSYDEQREYADSDNLGQASDEGEDEQEGEEQEEEEEPEEEPEEKPTAKRARSQSRGDSSPSHSSRSRRSSGSRSGSSRSRSRA